jgi:hypothetical protein
MKHSENACVIIVWIASTSVIGTTLEVGDQDIATSTVGSARHRAIAGCVCCTGAFLRHEHCSIAAVWRVVRPASGVSRGN